MTKIAEYRDVNDSNRAKCFVHREGYSPRLKTTVKLVQSSQGYEPAGSMARWTDGFWAVWWYDVTGSRHGQRYNHAGQAESHFYRLLRS